MVLNQPQLLHRNTDAVSNHGHMQVNADGLGMYGEHTVLIDIGIATVRLQVQMGLAGAVGLNFHHIGCGIKVKVRAFDTVGFVIGVGNAGMDLNGVLRNGIHGVHVSGQLFNVHFYRIGSGSGMGFGIGGHNGDGVTELENLLITQNRTLPAIGFVVQRQHDKTVDAVLSTGCHNILGGDDLEHTGHFFGFGCINALDIGMADLCLNQGQTQGVGGHLQGIVRAKVPSAGDLLGGGGTDVLSAYNGILRGLKDQVLLGDFPTNDPGCIHDRINEGLIAGAAAEIPVLLEPVSYLLPGGRGIVVQQNLGGHNKTGGTEAALGAAVGHPGHLQRVHIGNGADALNGGDLRAVFQAAEFGEAGTGDLAIDNNITCAAVTFSAANLTAGQQQTLPQERSQRFVLLNQDGTGNAVDYKCSFDHNAETSPFCYNAKLLVCTAGIFVRSVSGQILQTLHTAGGVKNQLGQASIQIFSPQDQGIGRFQIVNGQCPAVGLSAYTVCDLQGDLPGRDLKDVLVHGFSPPFIHPICATFTISL